MKYLGELDPRQLKVSEICKTALPPLPEDTYRKIFESIRESGVMTPLVVARINGEYVVLAGHHRLMIALELGIDRVPCELAETDKEREDALFDDLLRRQMTEAQAEEVRSKKQDILNALIRDAVAPEVYGLFTQGKVSRHLLNTMVEFSIDTQKQYLASLSIEVPSRAALEEQETRSEPNMSTCLPRRNTRPSSPWTRSKRTKMS